MPLPAHTDTFKIQPYQLPRQKNLKEAWVKNAPVPLDRLVSVHFSYITFEGDIKHDGQMIVLEAVAPYVLTIMKTLFDRKFPLHCAKPIEDFDGDDLASMRANNSSAFNCREIANGGGLPSVHTYGVAIDINPLQNPFVFFDSDEDKAQGRRHVHPEASANLYINRYRAQKDQLPGLCEDIVDLFAQNGFTVWGGTWNDPIDWHHFQTTRTMAQLLAAMSPEHAKHFFALYVTSLAHPHSLMEQISYKDETLIKLYQRNPDHFMTVLERTPSLLNAASIETGLAALKAALNT